MRFRYLVATLTAVVALSLAGYFFGGAASAADPTASGALKGKAKFEGTAPKPVRIDMSSDPNCAKSRTPAATTEDMVINADGGLANVVVYVSDGLGNRTFEP